MLTISRPGGPVPRYARTGKEVDAPWDGLQTSSHRPPEHDPRHGIAARADVAPHLIEPIPVQAVTGALMIICKEYFQMLGGFAEDYLFGHYEDADLCMRIWQDKGEVLLDTRVRLYHFEGQGAGSSASYMRHAQHLNRLKFTKKWINDHTHITANATDVQKMITESRGVIEQ